MPKLIDYASLIVEDEMELERLAISQKSRQNTDRLRFLRYLKTGQASTQAAAGALIGLKPRQSAALWALYAKGGLPALMIKGGPRHWGKLDSTQISKVLQRLDGDQVKAQREVAAAIKDETGVSYTQPGIHFLFKRLGVKLKTGRPSNVRKDEAGAVDFKKNSRP
jgi:transposase